MRKRSNALGAPHYILGAEDYEFVVHNQLLRDAKKCMDLQAMSLLSKNLQPMLKRWSNQMVYPPSNYYEELTLFSH